MVVTLVILLILAGITIATLFGENGIINKAQKAKEETEKSNQNELDALNSLEGEMENAINGNGWRQPDPLKPEITNGETTVKIGDYVDYSCKSSTATYTSAIEKNGCKEQTFKANAYNYGWRVLGVDKNTKQLQLISEDLVPLTGGGDMGNRTGQYYYLRGQAGYANAVDELNKICAIYGTGEGAKSARVVNIDDIDWITGYNPNNVGVKDPNKTGSGTKYSAGYIHEYGNDVKYTLLSTGVKYEPANSATSGIDTSCKQFTYYDEVSKTWKDLETNGSVILKSSIYMYYPTTLTTTNDRNATIGIESTSPEYKMLFTNSSTGADTANSGDTTNMYYWLGSPYIVTNPGIAYCGLRLVVDGIVNYNELYDTNGDEHSFCFAVRPVVSLDSKVRLKDSGTQKDGCKLYNMSVK